MTAPHTDTATTPQKVTAAQFRYHGTGGSLLGLVLVNGLLTILTLGVFSFWAKTRVRAFHYSHTELDGDRFSYHGTGGELLSGAIKATGIIMLLGFALVIGSMLLGGGTRGAAGPGIGLMLGFYVAIGLLVTIAINGARRYRLSRSSWRGIRLSYHGKWTEFLGLMVRGFLLSIVTLGLHTPFFQNRRRAYLVNNTRFGSEPFQYTADGRDLFRQFMIAVLLTIPTLGLYWIWYAAFKHRYFWGNTTMRGARFRSSVTGGELLTLSFTNVLLAVFTLGIGTPWVMTRTHAFWCDKISMRGAVDWATIEQQAQKTGSAAEGLADSFDIDIGIG